MPSFQDIPQIPKVYYTVNISWKYLQKWIEEHNDDLDLDMNPEFQRDYVWTEEQKIKYVEFILRGGESGKIIIWNHPNWMGSWKGRLVLVDGKQRISAVQDFLNNRIKAFGHYYKDYNGFLDTCCEFIFTIGKLKTDKEVYEWYLSMNTGGTYHTEEEIEKVKKLIENLED